MSTTWVGTVLVFISMLEAVTFVVAYHLLSGGQWRRDPIGRHVMAFVGVDAAVLLLSCVRIVFGATLDTGWFAWVRVAVFLGVPWVLGWRLAILFQLRHRREHRKEES